MAWDACPTRMFDVWLPCCFLSYVTMIHGILCQKKTWRSYSWFNPLLNRRNRCVFPPLGLAQAKIMRKIMTMKNMSQHGDSSDDLNCLKCSKMSSRKIPQAGRTSDPKRSKMHTSSEHYASQNMENLTQPRKKHFFFIPRVSQPEPMVREWQCPTCFQGLLTAVSGISGGRNTWSFPERWISKGLKKEKVTYPIDTISLYIHICIFVWTYISTII